MRVATVDGLLTLFYDGSEPLVSEWLSEWCDEHDFESLWNHLLDVGDWESWDLSDECKRYFRQRLSWQQIIIVEGVTEIPENTFQLCWNVKRVIFADTVVTIGEFAFSECKSLAHIKLSINLDDIMQFAFEYCDLSSVFIPPRCQFIGPWAFSFNKNLKIVNVPQETYIDEWNVIARSKLLNESDFQIIRDDRNHYDKFDGESEEIVDWIKSINNDEEYSLHRACCSFQPLKETIMTIILQQGIGAFCIENEIGITPAHYLKKNPYADILEMDIIQEYILKMFL